MCQFCRFGRRSLKSWYSKSSLLDTSKFSTLIVKDHRQDLGQLPLSHQQSLPGEQNHQVKGVANR